MDIMYQKSYARIYIKPLLASCAIPGIDNNWSLCNDTCRPVKEVLFGNLVRPGRRQFYEVTMNINNLWKKNKNLILAHIHSKCMISPCAIIF